MSVWNVLSWAAVVGFLSLVFIWYEYRKKTLREIPLVVSLAAVAAVGRLPFAGLPSVQPTTFLVLISGYVFGVLPGGMVGIIAAFVSNLFLLHGPWTPWQMFAWGLAGCSGGWLGLLFPRGSKYVLAAFGFLWGFWFGWIMNFWYWMSFVYPLNWQTWISVNASSFYFDFAHAATNFVLTLLCADPLRHLLERYRNKLSVQHSDSSL